MSRALMSATIADQAGNAIQGAVVVVYETGGTTPVADMFTAASGGSPVTTLTSDSHGLIKGWFTVGRLVDLKVTDNAHAAYRPASPSVHLTFSDYTITVAAADVSTDMATQAELDAEATLRVSGDAASVATAAADATAKVAVETTARGTAVTAEAAARVAGDAASQPLDSDLTAIAALSTTTYGRALLALADAAAGRTALGLGTAAVAASTAFDAAGAAAAAQAASQPVDSDLTAIAALSTTAFGRSFLDRADASAARTLLGLGTAATTDSTSYASLLPLGEQQIQTQQQHALRPWLAALANRDNAAVNVLMLGDSVTEGKGSTQVRKRYLSRFRDQIRSRFPVAGVLGGDGYVPARYIMSTPTGSGFAETGTAGGLNLNNGIGRRSVSLTDATTTLTLFRRCTSFDILFSRGVGTSFDVAIDGAAATTVSTTGAASNAITWNSGALGKGTHKIVITNAVGAVVVEGIMLYDGDESAGIRVWDGAHDGYTVSDFGTVPLVGNANWQAAVTSPIVPNLIVIALGLNDFGTFGVTAAAYQANLITLISQLRSKMTHPEACSIVLMPLYERGDATAIANKVDTWANFVTACYAVAAADTTYNLVAVCDVSRRMPITSEANFLSLYGGDQIHPADKGHAFIADALAGFLSQYSAGDEYGAAIAEMGYVPADFGYINWSFDPACQVGNVAGAAGTVYTTRVPIRRRASITNVHIVIGVVGNTLTNAFAALYQGGVLIGVTADESTAWTSLGEKVMALVGGPFTAEPGFVEVVWWVGTANTMPQMSRGSNTQGVNAGTAGKNLRNTSADTGITTTAPATLGARTALANALWAAVS